MTVRRTSRISTRKEPQQSRSADLVAAILDAAVQVLTNDGAQRFTTARVAERAGVSVGSLYQYFPNKAAILFRLQSDEWRATSALLRGVLEETGRPPLERLARLTHAFLRSECEEAAVRGALSDAAPLYRDAPEAAAARADEGQSMRRFLREALPQAAEDTRELARHLITTTLSEVGKRFSETPRTPNEIEVYADAMTTMFSAYLKALASGAPSPLDGAAQSSMILRPTK